MAGIQTQGGFDLMARSLPRVRPGVLARSHNLLAANIAMFFVDQMLKNDDEPIAVADLVHLTKEPRDKVVTALREMSSLGILSYPNVPWDEVAAVRLPTFQIKVRPC